MPRKAVVEIERPELQKRLSDEPSAKAIGANLTIEIPAQVLKNRHMDAARQDPFALLLDDAYDAYLTVEEIHFDDMP